MPGDNASFTSLTMGNGPAIRGLITARMTAAIALIRCLVARVPMVGVWFVNAPAKSAGLPKTVKTVETGAP
jgi:hypothetical protein